MIRSFKLPDLGEGVHEGEIRRVLVSPGQVVTPEQPILEVETDKVSVEITSPYAGMVQEVRVKPGQVARVGETLITFEVSEAEPAPQVPDSGQAPADATAPAFAAQPAGDLALRRPPAPAPSAVPEVGAGQAEQGQGDARPGPVPATPATRRLARELGVDLAQVAPSGPGGRVTAQDVEAHAAAAAGQAQSPEGEAERSVERTLPGDGQSTVVAPTEVAETAAGQPAPAAADYAGPVEQVERVALSAARRAAARHLAESWRQVPHVYHQDVADVTALEAYRQRYRAEIAGQGGRLTLTVFVLKAAVAALKAFPMFNASFDAERDEVILKRYYHIGVATDTERGLLVPVVRHADRKSIAALSVEMAQLAERVRSGAATLEDLRGGTFTLTNIGALGGTGATAIINYPESAILGLGSARLRPAVAQSEDDADAPPQIVPRLLLPLFLGFDHRVANGVEAAGFVRRVIEILEHPDKLALWL